MESSRVVRTRVPIGGDLFVFGSGYLVAPGRVLTARHVLSAPGQVASDGQLCQVRVWPCGPAQDWIDGSVEWLHDSRDVALVRADALGPDVDPVVWGQVVGYAPIEWTATGYPVASLDEDERVEEEALGVLAPISASSTGGLILTITSREPTEGTVRHSGWEGLSGAAVFCGPALLGIVTADPAKYTGSLTGIRTSHIVDQPDFVDRLGVALSPAEVRGAAARARVGQPGEGAAPGATSRVKGDPVSTGVEFWRDRDELRAELRLALLAGPGSPRILSVTGRRGIGKSATVAKVVSEFETSDPTRAPDEDLDALVYLSTRTGTGSITAAAVFDGLAALAPKSVAKTLRRRWEQAGEAALPELWDAMRERRCALVLDDLDEVLVPNEGPSKAPDLITLLTSVCSTRYPPRVLTTSDRPLDLPGALRAHVREFEMVDGLGAEDSVALVRSRDRTNGFAEFSDNQLAQATKRLHGIPHGIDLLSNLLMDDPFLLDDVIESQATLDQLLKGLVSRVVIGLDGPSHDVVDVLALAGVPLPMAALPDILAGLSDPTQVRAAIRTLVRRGGVRFEPGRPPRPRTLRLHPVEADWCTQKLFAGDTSRREGLDRRLADWYSTQRMPAELWRSAEDVNPQRLEFRHRWRSGDPDEALAVLALAARFLARKGETAFLRGAIAEAETAELGAAGLVARERCRFGLEFFAGSLDRAEAASVLAAQVARSAGMTEVAPELSLDLGTVLRHRGEHAAAVEILTEVTSRGPGADRSVWLDALFEIGLALCAQRRWEDALAVADELAGALRPDELPKLAAGAGDIRALAHFGAGNYAAALVAADEAAAAYLNTPYQDDAGYLYNVAGMVRLAQGELAQSRVEFGKGEKLADEYRIERLAGICATNLAWTELRAGNLTAARRAAERGSARLGATGVRAAGVPRTLVEVLSSPTPDALPALRRACLAGQDNPDLYQPSQEFLVAAASHLESRT